MATFAHIPMYTHGAYNGLYTTGLLNPFATTVVAYHMGNPYVATVSISYFDPSAITSPGPVPAFLTDTFLFHMSTLCPGVRRCTGAR
jgi:hypothetical protein